jgi:hypothetical protein
MSYREETHSKECFANAIKSALENIKDDAFIGDVEFRIMMQRNDLLDEADSTLDFDQVGADSICTCDVRAQWLVETQLGGVMLTDVEQIEAEEVKEPWFLDIDIDIDTARPVQEIDDYPFL